MKYDWTCDEKWLPYLAKVTPEPTLAKLEEMKRRWFRVYVDITFNCKKCSTMTPTKREISPKKTQN